MAPINLPDGSQVSEIVLPDGSTASEVLAPDGSTVFGNAIPDSVVDNFEDTPDGVYGTGDDIATYYDEFTSSFARTTADVLEGSTALECDTAFERIVSVPGDGLGSYPSKGDVFASLIREEGDSLPSIGWGYEDTNDSGYRLLWGAGRDESFFRRYDDGSFTTFASPATSANTGEWYDIEVEWHDGSGSEPEDEIVVTVYEIDAAAFDPTTEPSNWRQSEVFSVQTNDATYATESGVSFRLGSSDSALPYTCFDFYRIYGSVS